MNRIIMCLQRVDLGGVPRGDGKPPVGLMVADEAARCMPTLRAAISMNDIEDC